MLDFSFVLDQKSTIESSASSMLRNANLISMRKKLTNNDKNMSTKIVAARFEKNVDATEVSAKKTGNILAILTAKSLITTWKNLIILKIYYII